MQTELSILPMMAVLVSLAAVPLIVASSARANLREFWTLAAAVAKFSIVLAMLPKVMDGVRLTTALPEIAAGANLGGITLALEVDRVGYLFALVASGLWIFTSLYSIGYVRGLDEHKQTRYFASFAVCLSSTIGIAFSANLLTFLIFYEMLTLATYPLVIHKETPEAISAGRKYLAYTLTAGLCLLLAVAWIARVAPGAEFRPGGFLADANLSRPSLVVLFALLLVGTAVKAGVMPLHGWLPSAMAAPTPVSALLHAVAVVKAGVFGVVRVVGFVFGPELLYDLGIWQVLAWAAGSTVVLASLIAMTQDNLKRRLAYSTVAHLSYIVLGAALLTPTAIAGAMMHLVNHATMKITLFFCAGAIYVRTHRENVSEMNGIGRQMPITLGAFALASLGLAGVPPMNGFVSKWYLAGGTLEASQPVFFGFLLLSGLLNAAYLLPVVYRGFFLRDSQYVRYGEASMFMVVPLVVTAIVSLVLGIAPDAGLHVAELARDAAGSIGFQVPGPEILAGASP